MTMIQIVRKLQSQGHLVDFYVRKDGGILIRQIDGERFTTGATGNARARQLVGTNISEARAKQLKYATRQRRKTIKLDNEVQEEFTRVKKLWNKAFKSAKGTPHPAGYFGKARIQYAVQHYGKKEALRRIREAERYASGIAYSKNVQILANFVRMAGNHYGSADLLKLADDIEQFAYTIRDEWINPAYDELYKLNAGVPPEEVARMTRSILRL